MSNEITYKTFNGFKPHFNALAKAGYFKIVPIPASRLKLTLHNIYRFILGTFIIMYNIQHIIRVVQVRHSTDQMVDTLFILLTTINALGKEAAFNLRSRRIDDIIDTINGPSFAPSKANHVENLKTNAILMARLLTLYHVAALSCAFMWAVFPFVNRALGEKVYFTGYIPFESQETPAFELALAYMSILISFQAYGNVTMDCTIVAFYAQAQMQIKMLRYNLEHLVDLDDVKISLTRVNEGYKDIGDGEAILQKSLKKCAVHYKQILGYTSEVESIFGEAMVVQFFVMAWVICMTMYKIVGLSIVSVEFVSMAMYLVCMLAQLFIYCYFGTQLQVESEFINQSIYNCDWISLSPRFRRQLLVMMEYCSRPLAPRIAYIIPMSLETYINVLRSSYTLFTFLNRS